MGSTRNLANLAWRDYETDGVPSSGVHNVAKADARAVLTDADTRLGAVETAVATTSIVVATWAALSVIVGTAHERAEVYSDAGTHTDPVVGGTVANTGVYAYSTSPAGWQWISADALSSKAPLASPALTGTPTVPTATPGNSSTQAASTKFVADSFAPLASPALTGTPTAPTAAVDTNTTQLATTAMVIGQASSSGDGTPAMDGSAARGTSTHFARADHLHPTDTTRAPLASPALTGTPTAPTAAVDTNTTQLATTAMVIGQASSSGDGTPAMDGSAARGTSTHFARADHLHPTDTTRAAAATTITAAGLVTGGGDLSANRTVTVTAAIAPDMLTGASTSRAVTPAAAKAVTDSVLAIAEAVAGTTAAISPYTPALAMVNGADVSLADGRVLSPFAPLFVCDVDPCALVDGSRPINLGDVVDLAASATLYYGGGRSSGTTGRAIYIVDRTGVLRRLRAAVDIAPSAGQTIALTLRKNGTDTAITCTISGTGTTAVDLAHDVSVVAGDLIELKAVASAAAATNHGLSATIALGV